MDTTKLNRALTNLWVYLQHRSWCDIDTTDFCTCGLREATNGVVDALKEERDARK